MRCLTEAAAVEVIRNLDRMPTRHPGPKMHPWCPYIRELDGESSRPTMNSARCGTCVARYAQQYLG